MTSPSAAWSRALVIVWQGPGTVGFEQSFVPARSLPAGNGATYRTVAAEAGAAKTSAATTAAPATTPRPERSLLSTGTHLNMATRGLSSTQKERTPTLNTHAIPLHERRERRRNLVGLVVEK